jgi:hypothetical protein
MAFLLLHEKIDHRVGHAHVDLAFGQIDHMFGGRSGGIHFDLQLVLGLVDHGGHGGHCQIGRRARCDGGHFKGLGRLGHGGHSQEQGPRSGPARQINFLLILSLL